MTREDAFTSKQAIFLSGCTSHQLRYWDKVGLVTPSIQSSNGKPGVPKLYSFRDIVSLRVIKTLLDNGMSIQRVRRAWSYLKRNGELGAHLSNVKLITDGSSIYSVEEDKVFDALKMGQLAFFETIDQVARDVEEDLSKFELDKQKFLKLLSVVEDDVLTQTLRA
ncbi:MAG: MerR family transcriptional regulator [Candidatus Actinomarinales bacterium]|nr:MAG: MerR family transcriptional regulator [Candidatus Actinomarinales bacterium]